MLEVPEAVRCVLFYMLKAAEGELCLREVLEVPEEREVMRCVPVCMLEAVGGGRYVLELLEVVLYALEGVPCAALKKLDAVESVRMCSSCWTYLRCWRVRLWCSVC